MGLRMTETLTPPRISSPLDKRCHLPVEQTKDQRRTTFFGAVRDEAGNPLSDERIPVVYGGEYVNVSEVAEAMEGARKDLMDDHLPNRKMEEVELTDAVIRILDYAGGFNLDLQGAFEEKMAYNKTRADHSIESRKAANGKKF